MQQLWYKNWENITKCMHNCKNLLHQSCTPSCCYDYEVVNPPCFSIGSVATETEKPNDMNVESNHTAERESEQTDHGNAVAVQTTLGDEGLITF